MSGDFGRLERNGPTVTGHGTDDLVRGSENWDFYREDPPYTPLMLAPLQELREKDGEKWDQVIDVYMHGVRELPRTFESRSPK